MCKFYGFILRTCSCIRHMFFHTIFWISLIICIDKHHIQMLLQRARECHHGSMLLLIVFQQVEMGNATFTPRVPEGAAIGDKFSVKLPGMTTFMKISRCRSEIHVFLSPCACRPAENVLYNCVKSTSWYANCCAAAPNSGNLIYPSGCNARAVLASVAVVITIIIGADISCADCQVHVRTDHAGRISHALQACNQVFFCSLFCICWYINSTWDLSPAIAALYSLFSSAR